MILLFLNISVEQKYISESIITTFNFSREHLLTRMIRPMALTKVTYEMYEEESFLRRRNLLTFLIQILEPLDDCHIVLENSITQGIPSQC